MPTKVIASSLALIAFAVAIFVGVLAENPPMHILLTAIWSMFGCYFGGWIIGAIAQRAIDENVADFKRANPLVAESEDPESEADGRVESEAAEAQPASTRTTEAPSSSELSAEAPAGAAAS